MASPEVRNDLHRAMTEAILRVTELARGAGIDVVPDSQFEVAWLECRAENLWESQVKEVSRGTFGALLQAIQPGHVDELPEFERLKQACLAFEIDLSGRPTVFGQAWYRLLDRFLELNNYRVVSDTTAVAAVIDEYAADLQPRRTRTLLLLRDFAAPGPFTVCEGIRFAPIGESDIELLGRVDPLTRNSGFLATRPSVRSDDWICEILQDRGETEGLDQQLIDTLIHALSLTVAGRAEVFMAWVGSASRFLSYGGGWKAEPTYTSAVRGRLVLTETHVAELCSWFQTIRRVMFEPRLKFLMIPLGRFRAAQNRRTPQDEIVDCVVGMETLLGPDSQNLEITFRFRFRGAALLPDSFGDASERLAFMSDLYKMRSAVVHGRENSETLNELLPRTEEAFRHILRWFLTQGVSGVDHEDTVKEVDRKMVAGFRLA